MAADRNPLVKLTKARLPDVEARLAKRRGINYFPLTAVFDNVQGDQFLDHFGQVMDHAKAVIAAAITERLVPLLQRQGSEVSANPAPRP